MRVLTKLFNHQIKAVDKLSKVKVGAAYMEMGTGKTLTALELIRIRLAKGRIDHVLWLCPCSVKETLKRDIIKHTGSCCSDLITICGIETLSNSTKVNVALMNLVETKRCYLIVDESNLVKNYRAKRTERIIGLSKKCIYKNILNGTPISRSEEDLFSQWYILDWRILGYQSFWSFANNHLEYDERIPGKVNRTLNTEYLVEKIVPYSYQVKKSECLDLPEKTYEVEYFSLSDEQEVHYNEVQNILFDNIDELEPHTIYKLLSTTQSIVSGFYIKDVYPKTIREKFFEEPLKNPRIQKLLEIISKIEEEKVIIFAKYTDEINDIVLVLNKKYGEGSAVAFNGKVNHKQRQENLKEFENNAKYFVANKQCGSYGLNLQFCNYIVYYSNDWDYSTRSQSEDRVHRIGQDKNVHIIDICAGFTVDERILRSLENKENLIDSFKEELHRTKDKTELIEWLTIGRYKKRMKTIDRTDLTESDFKTAYFTKDIDKKFDYIKKFIKSTPHANVVYFCPKKYSEVAKNNLPDNIYIFYYEDINKTNDPYNTTNEDTILILDGSARYKNITSYVFKRIEKLALIPKVKLMVDIVPFTTDIMYSYIPFSHLKRQILGHQHWYAFRENNQEYNSKGELVEGHDYNLLAEKMYPVTKIDYEHFMECKHKTLFCKITEEEQQEYDRYRDELFEKYNTIQPVLTRLADFVNTRESRYIHLYELVKKLKGTTIVYTNIKSHNAKIKKLLKEFKDVDVRTFYDNNDKEQYTDNIILAEVPIVKNYLFLDVIANSKKSAKFYFITGKTTIDELLYKKMIDEFTQIDEFTRILSKRVNNE